MGVRPAVDGFVESAAGELKVDPLCSMKGAQTSMETNDFLKSSHEIQNMPSSPAESFVSMPSSSSSACSQRSSKSINQSIKLSNQSTNNRLIKHPIR